MNDREFPALDAQLRRAEAYLWVETVLSGFQCFVKVTAGIIASMALLSLSGLVSLPYWSPAAGAAIGAATMLWVIATRAPNLCKAAELLDKWTDRPDLVRTCLVLPTSHSASRLVAEQAEAAARMLPASGRWPALHLRSMALPVSIIFAGVIVMPGPRDASATDSNPIMHPQASAIAIKQEDGEEPAKAETASGNEEPPPSGNTPSERSNLMAVLTEEFDASAVEIDPLGDKRDVKVSAGVDADGDGAGRGVASQVASSTRIDQVVSTDASLQLLVTGTDGGGPLETGGLVPIDAKDQPKFVTFDPLNGLFSNRLASFTHVDRALARRYLEKRSGIR